MRNKQYLDWNSDLRGAVSTNNLTDVIQFVKSGADINELDEPINQWKIKFFDEKNQDVSTGASVLSIAVYRKNIDMVNFLIKSSAIISDDCLISAARLSAKYMKEDFSTDYDNINIILKTLVHHKNFSQSTIKTAIAAMVEYECTDNTVGMKILSDLLTKE